MSYYIDEQGACSMRNNITLNDTHHHALRELIQKKIRIAICAKYQEL